MALPPGDRSRPMAATSLITQVRKGSFATTNSRRPSPETLGSSGGRAVLGAGCASHDAC
jgi:hypothetical protein